YALMSIGAIRGVEFGAGFAAAEMSGSRHNDTFYLDGDRVRTRTNNAGGILGGISTGEDIVVRAAVKPASSIAQKQQTVSNDLKAATIEVKGRHDPCICPRVVPVVEAMTAIVLVDAVMMQKALK
ncbi:MAG: chorismate synthase, partial [Candidatus Omnitrophica bacterium]|nr:chorismate synthase [Candidatus Omnitrophota bacterium]